jgi:hypothetical protein
MYQYNSINGAFIYVGNLTDIINNITISITDWKFSNDCSRILISNSLLVQIVNTTFSSIILTKTWISADQSLIYALDTIGIWKFDSTLNSFTKLYVYAFKGLNSNVYMFSTSSALILYSTTSLYSFAYNGSNLIPILNTLISSTISNPTFSLSSSLTNVLIYGNSITNASTYSILCYNFNYTSASYQNITFPTTYIVDITKTTLLIEDNWIYVRQLNYTSTDQNGNL